MDVKLQSDVSDRAGPVGVLHVLQGLDDLVCWWVGVMREKAVDEKSQNRGQPHLTQKVCGDVWNQWDAGNDTSLVNAQPTSMWWYWPSVFENLTVSFKRHWHCNWWLLLTQEGLQDVGLGSNEVVDVGLGHTLDGQVQRTQVGQAGGHKVANSTYEGRQAQVRQLDSTIGILR